MVITLSPSTFNSVPSTSQAASRTAGAVSSSRYRNYHMTIT